MTESRRMHLDNPLQADSNTPDSAGFFKYAAVMFVLLSTRYAA